MRRLQVALAASTHAAATRAAATTATPLAAATLAAAAQSTPHEPSLALAAPTGAATVSKPAAARLTHCLAAAHDPAAAPSTTAASATGALSAAAQRARAPADALAALAEPASRSTALAAAALAAALATPAHAPTGPSATALGAAPNLPPAPLAPATASLTRRAAGAALATPAAGGTTSTGRAAAAFPLAAAAAAPAAATAIAAALAPATTTHATLAAHAAARGHPCRRRARARRPRRPMPPPGTHLYELPFCNPTCAPNHAQTTSLPALLEAPLQSFLRAGDSFALMDAGVAGFEEAQNVPCATFYGAGCGLYRDLLLDLTTLGGSPAPPPPPLPVLGASADVAELKPTRIFFARGPSPNMQTSLLAPGESDALTNAPYRQRQRRRELQSQDTDGEGGEADYLDVSDDPVVIRACSDVHTNNEELSLCETNGFENAVRFAPLSNPHALYCKFAIHADNCACHRAQWVMYDLGAEYDLRAVRLVTYKFGVPPPTPPPPPRPPPPRPPPRPPPSPPKPPPPPESPPPPFYFQCIGSIGTSDCYHEHVLMANNGVCEDGAEGSTSNVCLWGTDYPDCPYRCSPGGDWYAVPSDYMVQVIGGDDAECEPSVAYNDDRGRAVIEEGHNGDYSSCGNGNRCAARLWLQLGVGRRRHRDGGHAERRPHDSVPASLLKIGQLLCHAGRGPTTANWHGHHELASYTVEHSPRVDDGFVTQACGPEHKDCPGGVCTCDNQNNWWKYCGGGEDHTSVYVNEHRRKDYVQKFGVSTVNGICEHPGSWRYEGIEIYVLPYARHDGVHCSGSDSTRNPGALAVHVNTGETEQEVNGAYSQDFSDTLGPGATAEECARWCTGLGNHLCNAFTMWVDAYDEHYCSLKQVDRLLPITTPCPTPHPTSATYVFTGLLGGDSPPPSPPPSPPSPPPPPPPPSPPSPPPAEWVACGDVIGIVAVGEVHTVPCVSDGNPAQAIRLVSYGPYHAAFAQVVVPGVAALGYGWESCLMYSSGGTAQFWGEGGEVEHPGSGCCDGDSSGYACIEQESGPGGYFEGIFETPSAITSVVVTTRTRLLPRPHDGIRRLLPARYARAAFAPRNRSSALRSALAATLALAAAAAVAARHGALAAAVRAAGHGHRRRPRAARRL